MFHFKKKNGSVHSFSLVKCSIPTKIHADANKLLAVKIIARNRLTVGWLAVKKM